MNSHRNALKDHDWGLNYAPTETQSVALPRGQGGWGSSAVNTTIALRGIPEDYDSWAEAAGRAGLGLTCFPISTASSATLISVMPAPRRCWANHYYRYKPHQLLPHHQAFMADAETLGYPHCPDANHPDEWGASPSP